MASRDASNNCERKYQCKFCPKCFSRSSVLTDHIRVHTGEKPFQCETCLRSFSQLANLNRHHKIHTKDQTFKCKYCVERFSQLALLLRHETTHTVHEIKDYPQDIPSLTYPVIPFGNQTAVPSSLNVNSNQAENIRTSVQLSTKNLTSLSNFLQIPSSNFQEDDIFALNQALNTDDFQQQIQTSLESGNICHANNLQNTHVKTSETFFHDSNNIILVSEESQESLSFGQQISPNCSEGSDAPPPRVKLEFSTNTFVDSRKCFYNPSERNNSSFDLALRTPSDELKVIDIKPDLSVLSATNNINKLSPVYNTISINTADSLNAALQLSSTNQDDFGDSQERNYNDIFENVQVPAESIQYFKSESELCFDNNDLPRAQAATNDFIQGSASGLKSFNNSQLNLSLPAVPSSFHFENSRTYIDCINSESHDMRRNDSNLDFGQLNISHSLSSEKLEVDQDEALVIGKQMKVDLGHLDCEKDVKVEFQSISEVDSSKIFTSSATHKAQRKLEDEQMTHQENSFDQRKKLVLYLDTKDSQEMESSSKITNTFKFKSSSDSISQNGHIESSDKICRDLESSDIILLSPSSSLQSTSQPSSPLPHSIQKNQVALNSVDKPSISCNFDDGSNQDVLITCETSLEKPLEEETRHQSEFDAAGKIAVEEVSENLSIVIESVFSMNNKDKPGLSARKELSENSLLSSLVVKHSGISDQNKPRSEVEVIDLVDFSPKEMRSDEQHNWAVPLVDIQEITTQKLDAESNFKIQAAEIEDDTSEEPNSASTKIWDIGSLETDSREPLLELTPSFQQTTNNDAKNIPDLPNHVVSLEPSCFTCSCCKEGFSNKSTLLSHLCAPKSPYSPLAEDVDQIHLKPRGQSCEKACETAANSPNLTEFHLSQTEKFICKYCNKHFSQTSILVKHIETHIDKKPFVCDLCQRPFSQLTNLNHDRKLHFRDRMLHCQFCQRTFPHSFQLLNHLKYHARSIHRSIKALEDTIRQKRKKNVLLKTAEKVSNKSLKLRASPNQKYLKMKPKITQLSKKNVNQSNGRNSLIPVLPLKRSHSDPQFNAISPKNDENLNTEDLCNKEMRKCLIGQKYLNSIEVSGNLTRITSSDSFVENTSAGECANMSRTNGQEEEHVNQIEFAFSVKASEDQCKINTDSGSCTEQFRSENNSSHILENSKSEEANKSLQNVLVQIQPSELFSHIEYRENLPQKDILPIPSSLLQKNHSRDHITNPDDNLLQTDLSSMQSGFCSVDVTTTAVNSQNISGDEHLSEVIFVTSNCAADTPDQSSPSNAPVKSGQFHCKICNKSFNQKFILIKHLRTHTGEKPYKCEFCPRLFSQLNNLNRHRKSHLPLGLFPCKFCPTKHRSISELNVHNRILHIGMKPYICKFCSKRFSRSSVLREHIRTHTGEKPFVCELCNRAFSQATNLNRHMKIHVPGRIFHCRYCSSTFKQYWHFKRHLKTHIHLGKMSNENAFIRKTKRQHSIQQIIPRRTKLSKSNGFICKLSDSNKHKLTRRIQSFQEKTENLGSKQDSCHITGSYEPATFPDLLKASSFQHCSNIQPYEEILPNITETPEILAINGHLLPAPNNSPLLQLEMQSVVTPTGLVPNFCHVSFQKKLTHVSSENGDNSLHNNVPSNYPFLLTTDQNQMTTNKSSSSFGLVNNSESFTKHKVSGRVNAERNNNNAFVHSDCKSLREADDDNQSKDNSRSDIELAKNYQNNGVGILWRAAHENWAKTNSRSKDLFIDNYETVGESLKNEDDTTLVSPVHSLSVNVKLEPEDLNIGKQSESAPKNSNSDSLCRNQSVVPFKEFPCIYCNKLFHHSQVLCRHLRSHHKSEMMMTSTCQLCQVSFPDSDALNRHHKTCCQLLLPYFCNLCKEKFPNFSELSRHRQRKHSGGVKRYSCRYCTKVFSRNSVLTEHIRTHTGERPFVCELCLRPFSQATNLKRHQKIHTRNGSFVCKYCQASFSQLSLFSRHLRMHAEEKKHQKSAMEECQLENQAVIPFLKETEKFSKTIKISENDRNGQKMMRSKTRLFATKNSAIVHIAPGKSTETLTNNDFNKSFKKPLSNISQRQEGQLQNYEIENITEEDVLEVSKSQTNSEPENMQEELQETMVSSDAGSSSFSQTHQFEQIDTTMEGPGVCYSSLRRDVGEKPRENQNDDLSVNIAGRTQGVITSSVPIISPQTHFSDAVSPNFFEQQKGEDCLELSSQPLININLSIVKREENQPGSCSSRSCDQPNFQSYDSSNVLSQQTMPFITQTPDLKPITPNIEIHRFTPDLITPAGRGQDSAINKPYQCPECSLAFATQEQHNNHISTHLETMTKASPNKVNLPYSCKFCKLRFPTSRQLFYHQQLKHPRMKSHQCKYCGRFFARTTVLTEHIRTHTGEKPFVCNMCNRAFSQMTNLKRHQKIHDRKSITCRYCKAVFTDYVLLLKHMQSHAKSQQKNPKSFKSDVPASSDIYARISARIKNMTPKSGRVNSQNQRGTMQAKFPLNRNESCLSNHEPSFVIDQEDERIFTLGSSAHSASLSDLDSGSSSSYFHLQNLQEDKRHTLNLSLASPQNESMLSEISSWPWKTNRPSKIKSNPKSVTSKFREQTFWSNHLFSGCGEQQGGQRKDTDLCIIPETSVSKLSRLAEFSSDISQPGSLNDTKKYSCRYCKKIFLQINDLHTHSTCHGREKRYKCKYCSRTFGRSSVLKQHVRIHTGEKPFKCDQCLRCFTQSTNLKRHMKLHRADNQIFKNSDSKKKSHFRAFSHGFHKQLGYYGKSKFRKYNKKSIPLKQFELNSQNHYEGESGRKNIFPPFSNLTIPTTTSQLSIIASQSHHNSLQTASEESILINSGNTMYDTTVIAPELNSLKQNSNTDDSLIVLSSSRGKKTDTIYLQINEENETKVPLQPGSPTRATYPNFMPAVETINHSTKVSFCIKAEIAANKEPMPSDHYVSNNYRSIKNPRIEASTPRTGHTKPAKRIHVCKICKEVFANRWKLSTHLKSHFKRLFQCTFCEKGFTRSSVLREHIRTHTGEKPFKCTHCQRSFSQMTNLKRHLKLHNRQPQTAISDSLTSSKSGCSQGEC